jgi:hypothetical protein
LALFRFLTYTTCRAVYGFTDQDDEGGREKIRTYANLLGMTYRVQFERDNPYQKDIGLPEATETDFATAPIDYAEVMSAFTRFGNSVISSIAPPGNRPRIEKLATSRPVKD